MSEPKDAAAARRIIRVWANPRNLTPDQYALVIRYRNARASPYTPAKWSALRTPAVGVEPFDIK